MVNASSFIDAFFFDQKEIEKCEERMSVLISLQHVQCEVNRHHFIQWKDTAWVDVIEAKIVFVVHEDSGREMSRCIIGASGESVPIFEMNEEKVNLQVLHSPVRSYIYTTWQLRHR